MADESERRKKQNFAKRLFRVVGQVGSSVGSTVGDLASGALRSAGRQARNAGGRAALSFSREVKETAPAELRDLAESFTQWLLQEHGGQADLQQQKPSTIELSELGQVSSFYEVCLQEPGFSGRRFRFIFRSKPLTEPAANFPHGDESFDQQALLVMGWPQGLVVEPSGFAVAVWDHAALLGKRNAALDLVQAWLSDEFGGTFSFKRVYPNWSKKLATEIPLFGREEELDLAKATLLTPRPRELRQRTVISLAAPGGTGKSFFLKALKAKLGHRLVWAGIDHQGLEKEMSGVGLLGRCLTQLAQALESQSVVMDRFRRELRSFQNRVNKQEETSPSGFFGHLRKAAESAAGINPVFGVASAGVIFLTSWGQQAKEESEALAKDDAVKALTEAFKHDLQVYCDRARAEHLCWMRPVLVFDTYEWLAPLVDTWVRTDFLSADFLEKSGVCLILSGREHLLRTDTRWSEWRHKVTNISLEPFPLSTTEAYLQTLGVEPERIPALHDLTEGLPLFLSLAAHIEQPDQAVGILAGRVLEEVEPDDKDRFLKASLLDSFERSKLQKLFANLSTEEVDKLHQSLLRASFTVAEGGKRAFMGPVRRILRRALLLELGAEEVARLEESL
jgi:hypothetical protein